MNILVIDVGTSSMRGILFDNKGNNLKVRQTLYKPSYGENSWVEQNPSDWEEALYDILMHISLEAKDKNWEIDAISLTSQRSSVIPVDHDMKPLCNAILWQDKRSNHICKELEKENKKIFQLCGSRVNPVFSASKMTWIRENCPEVYKNTYKFLTIADYLLYRLTGELHTDYTYGSRSLLMNIRTHEWEPELLDLFSVEKEKLCDLIEPGTICGHITGEIEKRTGCKSGMPVITAGGDQQCGAIGQGVIKEGILSVTAGTGGFLITATEKIPENIQPDAICNFSSVKNQYILESSILTCCSAFDWFLKEFYPDVNFEEINAVIEQTRMGANGCICIPYFQGRSTPDWNNLAKGVFANVTLATKKADLLKSLVEGICYEISNGITVMKKYVKISDVYINGGLTNSSPYNQMQSNISGMRLIRRGKADATARGAFIVAANQLGIFTTIEDAYLTIRKNDEQNVYLPEPEAVLFYEEKRKQMNELYQKIYY